jgi:uncharacterized YccA/Bax inhibitor family protein
MSLFKSSNFVLSEKKLGSLHTVSNTSMTINGALGKFGIMVGLMLLSAFYAWYQVAEGANIMPLLYISLGITFLSGIVMYFKATWSPVIAPVYALAQGFMVGAVSYIYNDVLFADKYPNIVLHAVIITLTTCAAMFFLYRFQIIKATNKFKAVVGTATLSIMFFYLLTWVLGFFDINFPFLHEGSVMGIIFSVVVLVIAALNLILDFDMIEQCAINGSPKYMEWYCAFGLLWTVVWIYYEVLRLLGKIASRD